MMEAQLAVVCVTTVKVLWRLVFDFRSSLGSLWLLDHHSRALVMLALQLRC